MHAKPFKYFFSVAASCASKEVLLNRARKSLKQGEFLWSSV